MAPSQQSSGSGTSAVSSVYFERERGVTEVQIQRGLAHVTVRIPIPQREQERLALLRALATASVSVFLVKLHPHAVSFAVRANAVDACEALLTQRACDYTLLRDLGLVAIVAGAMRDLSGVIARIYETMTVAGVQVRQTGDAYNAVFCLVAGSETDRAAEALRKAFSLPEPEGDAGPVEGVGLKAL